MADQPDPVPTPSVRDEVVTVRVRRSPKYSVFLLLGAAAGILAALILTFAFPGEDVSPRTGMEYSVGQIFGFVLLICVPVGIALGGVVALVLDRVMRRRVHDVRAERVHLRD